jgi:catechol 2,3-dioxygenase-like lactoylglutathione lyase family enzyme
VEESTMLHHVSVGVRDVERATTFYDAILAALGYKRVMEFLPYAVGYGDKYPTFWVQLPHNQQPASVGNGVHIGFMARSKDAVRRFHAVALAKGGTSDGAPGPRPDYGPDYYGAFVIDFDGNKLEATLTPMPKAAPKTKKAAKAKAAKKPAKKAAAEKKAAPKAKKKAKRKAKKR